MVKCKLSKSNSVTTEIVKIQMFEDLCKIKLFKSARINACFVGLLLLVCLL